MKNFWLTSIATMLAICATGARGDVIITEIMYNSAGANDGSSTGTSSEWVEIFNTGSSSVDISGWVLDDEDAGPWGALASGSILLAGEAAVITSNPAEFNQSWGAGIKTFQSTWSNLGNTATAVNEVLVIKDSLGSVVDTANYESGTGGWPASGNGKSIYLKSVALSNDDGANWGQSATGVDGAWAPTTEYSPFVVGDVGSPGFVVVPEPTSLSLSLLLAGCLGFAIFRRR
jgi:hypothetical protein